MIKAETITPIKVPCLEDVFNSSNMYNIKILSTNHGKDILYTEINLPSYYLQDLLVIYFASKNTLLLNLILLHFSVCEERRDVNVFAQSISKRFRRFVRITDKNKYFGEAK